MSKTLIPNLSEYEQNLSQIERRKLDLVQQVLNVHSNGSNEKENIYDLFKTYANILKSSKIPNATLPLEHSEICFRDKHTLKNYVKSLENDNPQSFLIMPLYSNNHMFATVIRKRDNMFTATIVNKGDRPSIRGQFVEHTLSENGIEELIGELHNSMGEKSTRAIYSIFNKHSDSHKTLQLQSKDQKVGNCYIKEPENAIKFAFATINFTNKQFDELFKNPKHFKSKWEDTTVNMHRRFIEHIAKEHPSMIPALQSEMYSYEINKQFREAIEQNKDITTEQIKGFLPYMNMDTLSRIKCLLVVSHKLDNGIDNNIIEELRTMNQLANSNINEYGHKKFFNDLSLIEDKYPVLARQIKYEQHSDILMLGLNCLHTILNTPNPHPTTMFRHLNDSVKLYPNNFMSYAAMGLANLKLNHPDKALSEINKAIELKNDLAGLYYLRSQIHSKLEQHDLSKQDLKHAKQLDAGCIQRWKGVDNFDVLTEYYGLGYKPAKQQERTFNRDTTKLQNLLNKTTNKGLNIFYNS